MTTAMPGTATTYRGATRSTRRLLLTCGPVTVLRRREQGVASGSGRRAS